jgi:hypothetical protein
MSDVRRAAAGSAGLGLIVIAAALLAYALEERNTAEFVRSRALPGQQPPDTTGFDGSSVAAFAEAAIALVTAAAVWLIRGRAIFAVSGIWSAIALGTGAWIALTTTPRLSSVAVGPLALPIELVGAVLVLAALLCLIGSVIGWLASPAEAPAAPHMPPPTHQA